MDVETCLFINHHHSTSFQRELKYTLKEVNNTLLFKLSYLIIHMITNLTISRQILQFPYYMTSKLRESSPR